MPEALPHASGSAWGFVRVSARTTTHTCFFFFFKWVGEKSVLMTSKTHGYAHEVKNPTISATLALNTVVELFGLNIVQVQEINVGKTTLNIAP